ncbi:hypothetical protein [Clostridium botulinum]|uniref:hypothetical protein n=1 Tax=Clostridium botulinum TaxID=1491 RepID=UPI0007737346|nr:hypothetical protein [Clostridium botulinum]MBY6953051.1 hypothetical protein [Clostridium botulinum]MCR1137732.1 hypothetical protein [Clostridium botulinum]
MKRKFYFFISISRIISPILELGSCLAGVFENISLAYNSQMLELFNIPKGKKITASVIVAYAKYNYPRLVDRNPLEVTFYQSRI